jgi:hypothetical protein
LKFELLWCSVKKSQHQKKLKNNNNISCLAKMLVAASVIAADVRLFAPRALTQDMLESRDKEYALA